MPESIIAIAGMRTSIAKALIPILPAGETVRELSLLAGSDIPTRVLFADGLIYPRPINKQSVEEIQDSLWCNMVSTVRISNLLLERNPNVRICIVGSDSGINGSYDDTYALAKAGLHAYVKWKTVSRPQQLICVCPPLIADSYWVSQRHDFPGVLETRPHCKAIDVARVIRGTLYAEVPLSNHILHVRPTGGPGVRSAHNGV